MAPQGDKLFDNFKNQAIIAILRQYPEPHTKAGFPLGEFVRANKPKANVIRGRGTGGGGGGTLGASGPPLLFLGKMCPFSGMKVPYFHKIEVPFLQNLSALFGQCPLTFDVLPRPLNVIG